MSDSEPRSVEEWTAWCHENYLLGVRVEGRSEHVRHGLCVSCAGAYAAQECAPFVAVARAAEQLTRYYNFSSLSKEMRNLKEALAHPDVQRQLKEVPDA